MLNFENHRRGHAGLNNHVIPYTFCIALSNFLDRDFYFDFEVPTFTPPAFAVSGKLKEKFEIVMNSPRSLVSDLLQIENRRRFEIEREVPNKIRIEDPMLTFATTEDQRRKYEGSFIWNFFSLGRKAHLKEELQNYDLIEIGSNSLINNTFYFFLSRPEKNALMRASEIRYTDDIEKLSSAIVKELGTYNSIHIRLGDFLTAYKSDGYHIDADGIRNCFKAIFTDRELPVWVATDGLDQKDLFADLLSGFNYRFIDELIFGDFLPEFRQLGFTDFNVLSVLNQLICANAETFIGTCRSTLTSVIHRIRQERYGKTDFYFLPDERTMRVMGPDYKLKPDAKGFFEWNLYSVFAEHYEYPAWMREWNYNLTAID